MTDQRFQLTASSNTPNKTITAPHTAFTLKFRATSPCAPGKAMPYPANSDPSSTNKTAKGFRKSSDMVRPKFRIYHNAEAMAR